MQCPLWLIYALFLLSLATAKQALAEFDETWNGSLEQRLGGFITVWSEAKYNFPFFDQRPGLDWDEERHKTPINGVRKAF